MGKGWKPTAFNFLIPPCDVLFHIFVPCVDVPGDDLCQIVVEDVRNHAEHYAAFAKDICDRKGQTLAAWCDCMENSSCSPDELMLFFLAHFTKTHPIVLLKGDTIWSTGTLDDVKDYPLVFIYEGFGVFMPCVPAEASDHGIPIVVPSSNAHTSLPVLRKRTCARRRSSCRKETVLYSSFFAELSDESKGYVSKTKDKPAALKGPLVEIAVNFENTFKRNRTSSGLQLLHEENRPADAADIIKAKKHKAQKSGKAWASAKQSGSDIAQSP